MVIVNRTIKKTGLLLSFAGLFLIFSSSLISLTHYHGEVNNIASSFTADTHDSSLEKDIVCEIASLKFLGNDSTRQAYDSFHLVSRLIPEPVQPLYSSTFLPLAGRAPPVC